MIILKSKNLRYWPRVYASLRAHRDHSDDIVLTGLHFQDSSKGPLSPLQVVVLYDNEFSGFVVGSRIAPARTLRQGGQVLFGPT